MAINYGTSAITLVSDLLVQRGVCDHRQAFELAEAFDRELSRCAWIDTQDGIVFSREKSREPGAGNRAQCRF
jgi:hypothetical protein